VISYSPLALPITNGETIYIAKRDLFDARFQSVSETGEDQPSSEGEEPRVLDHLDSPSDLVPGKYEGGFKTWEASLDLVEYLQNCGPHNLLKDDGRMVEVSESLHSFGAQAEDLFSSGVVLQSHHYTFFSRSLQKR
jgi:hypothetical protein